MSFKRFVLAFSLLTFLILSTASYGTLKMTFEVSGLGKPNTPQKVTISAIPKRDVNKKATFTQNGSVSWSFTDNGRIYPLYIAVMDSNSLFPTWQCEFAIQSENAHSVFIKASDNNYNCKGSCKTIDNDTLCTFNVIIK